MRISLVFQFDNYALLGRSFYVILENSNVLINVTCNLSHLKSFLIHVGPLKVFILYYSCLKFCNLCMKHLQSTIPVNP